MLFDDNLLNLYLFIIFLLINLCFKVVLFQCYLVDRLVDSGPILLTFLPLKHQHNLGPTGFQLIQPDPLGHNLTTVERFELVMFLCKSTQKEIS